jgi:hypothetical protein
VKKKMKKAGWIALSVVCILLIAGYFVVTYTDAEELVEDWINPTGAEIAGKWRIRAEVVTEDGTTLTIGSPPLTVTHGGTEVTDVKYKLQCFATQTGGTYDTYDLDFNDMEVALLATSDSTPSTWYRSVIDVGSSYYQNYDFTGGQFDVWEDVLTLVYPDEIIAYFDSFGEAGSIPGFTTLSEMTEDWEGGAWASDTYDFEFLPSGTIAYRGVSTAGNGDWETTSAPSETHLASVIVDTSGGTSVVTVGFDSYLDWV